MFKTGRIRDIKADVSYSFKCGRTVTHLTPEDTLLLREVRGFRDSRMHKHNMSGSLSRQSSAPANGMPRFGVIQPITAHVALQWAETRPSAAAVTQPSL